jgi:hypothetical protein
MVFHTYVQTMKSFLTTKVATVYIFDALPIG